MALQNNVGQSSGPCAASSKHTEEPSTKVQVTFNTIQMVQKPEPEVKVTPEQAVSNLSSSEGKLPSEEAVKPSAEDLDSPVAMDDHTPSEETRSSAFEAKSASINEETINHQDGTTFLVEQAPSGEANRHKTKPSIDEHTPRGESSAEAQHASVCGPSAQVRYKP